MPMRSIGISRFSDSLLFCLCFASGFRCSFFRLSLCSFSRSGGSSFSTPKQVVNLELQGERGWQGTLLALALRLPEGVVAGCVAPNGNGGSAGAEPLLQLDPLWYRDRERKLRDRIESQEQQLKDSQTSEETYVTEEDIAEVVSMWTGIPLTRLAAEESERLLHMEAALHERIAHLELNVLSRLDELIAPKRAVTVRS